MTPERAHQIAGQVLRDTERMGLQAHHAQQLQDRIAAAIESAVSVSRSVPHPDSPLGRALEAIQRLDRGPEWVSADSHVAVPVWALRLVVAALGTLGGDK